MNTAERRVIEAAIVLRAAHERERRTADGGIAGATDALFRELDGLNSSRNDDSALMRLATATFSYLDKLRHSRPCVICGDDVDTHENGTDGAQLRNGAWVCSDTCWDAVNAQADALDEANAAAARLNDMLREAGYGQGEIDAYPDDSDDN